jgi:hypothetical protein
MRKRHKSNVGFYRVEEQSKARGGKSWRTMRGSKGTKDEAERYKSGVERTYGDRFRYRVVKYKR